jgi:hypothetical protein
VELGGEVELAASPVGVDPWTVAAGGGDRIRDSGTGSEMVNARSQDRALDVDDEIATERHSRTSRGARRPSNDRRGAVDGDSATGRSRCRHAECRDR